MKTTWICTSGIVFHSVSMNIIQHSSDVLCFIYTSSGKSITPGYHLQLVSTCMKNSGNQPHRHDEDKHQTASVSSRRIGTCVFRLGFPVITAILRFILHMLWWLRTKLILIRCVWCDKEGVAIWPRDPKERWRSRNCVWCLKEVMWHASSGVIFKISLSAS